MARDVAEVIADPGRWRPTSPAEKVPDLGGARLARACLAGLLLITSAGCAGAARPSSKIAVAPRSHICTVMKVDPAVVRGALSPYMDWDTIFLGKLARAFESRWPADTFIAIQNEERVHRYATEDGGPNPFCSRPGTDIFITLRYSPRANGQPYVVNYSVSRGSQKRTGTLEVDLAAEMKSGRVAGFNERRDISEIISDDADVRSKFLVSMLEATLR
jgi:hypothetical protein